MSVIIPEHVPAFAKKKLLKKTNIDPRTFVIIGDSEAAIAAVDALRTSFAGNIVLIPQSPFGQFENLDVLRRKFSPLSKNEVFYLDDDYMNRANIKVVPGIIKFIDVDKKEIEVKGYHEKLEFEKVLLAWGSAKKRLDKEFSNVFYLEDRQAHARCHNELLKAKTIVVLGGTIEAYQSAASIRDYLDSIGFDTP